MKIEKISENQIKFLLTHEDLMKRNMQVKELAYGSAKAQELFREIMERAAVECDFHMTPDTPLVIEAIPVDKMGMNVVVTKVTKPNGSGFESFFSSIFGNQLQIPGGIFPKMPFGFSDDDLSFGASLKPTAPPDGAKPQNKPKEQPYTIFTFDNLDDVAQACAYIKRPFNNSSVYKLDGLYYLVFENSQKEKLTTHQEALVAEHGRRSNGSSLSMPYLAEHGEVIIKTHAVPILSTYLV